MNRYEWESALILSTMWDFREIRALAIQKLSQMKAREVDKITLRRKYGVASWLLEGYTDLAAREGIIEEGGEKLGGETVVRLFRVREAGFKDRYVSVRCRGSSSFRYYSKSTAPYDCKNAIWSTIAQQLTDAENDPALVNFTVHSSQHRGDCASAASINEPKKNENFYMESIVFLSSLQVKDTLFCAPQRYFEHTTIFETIFTLLPADDTPIDGSDDEHPFKIEGIGKCEFRAFLHILTQ